METEVKLLQRKVTRLEETLKHLESETSRKIATILEQLISNRAEQVAAQKKVLENEEYFYQHLLSNCCWTTFKESDETVQIETEVSPDSILLQTLERANHNTALEIKMNHSSASSGDDQPKVLTGTVGVQRKSQAERQNTVPQTHQMTKRSSTRIDPLPMPILTLGYSASGRSSTTTTQRLQYEQTESLDHCSIQNATHKLSENPNISMTLNPAPSTSSEYSNVDFQLQPQQFYGDSDLEEVEEMQTSQIDEYGQKSWDDETYTDNLDPALYQPNVIYTSPLPAQPQQPTGTGSPNKSRKPNKCKLCTAAFTLKRTLLMHMATFHKSPQHQIQTFNNNANAQHHQDDQGKPQKRLFCKFPHCQKSYASTQNLKIHMRTHTGERPHICELCSKAFADPSCLRRHTIYFHGVGQNIVGGT